MEAVLYVGHGSRMKEAADEAIHFIMKAMKLVDTPIQEYCFLELSKSDIKEGVNKCVQRGATSIAVVPVLLLTAAHAKVDIPHTLNKVVKRHPDVKFTYGQPLGVQEKIIDALIERIEDRKAITNDMDILLVGRGSSDKEAVQDICTIAKLLKKRTHVNSVEVCFLAAASPRFEQKVKGAAKQGKKNVIILPYLLFTGVLMTSIYKTVNELNLSSGQSFIVSDYLGDHPNLYHLLKERVIEARKNSVL
ncbi:sirohydrochlorin chelatase [Halobacillus mangrovi]|uniref:sirohydrochlorin chelatase n=1 Tax=Halobacillus mangrovi TaxID=402384 RepID=UPI003D961DF4